MTWFKVDDGFHTSRKVKSIPPRQRFAAIGLWTVAGSWCAQELTDGHVPDYMIREWGATAKVVDALVESGLWARVHDGFEFRSWSEYNPTKDRVKAERAANKARVEDFRRRKSEERAGQQQSSGDGNALHDHYTPSHVMTPRPDPTRPDPITTRTNAAASPTASRETAEPQQPQPVSTEFSDGTPIPPGPDNDHGTDIVVDGLVVPDVIEPATRYSKPGKPSPAARTLVRSTVNPNVGTKIIDQLAIEVDKLRRDPNIDHGDIADALTEWATRPGTGPRLIPNLVADAARARTTQNAPHETSAMNRGREYIEIGERLAQRLEAQQSTTTSPKELR